MPTPLRPTSPVTRLLGNSIDGRQIIVTLEISKSKPVLRLRQKGYKTGWFLDLENLIEIASWHPRLKSGDMELMTNPKEELKQALQEFDWRRKYEKNGKDLIK